MQTATQFEPKTLLESAWRPVISVLIPCLNEAAAIPRVIEDFRAALPQATIFVYDNGSTDETVERARSAGAVVRSEPLRGKGNVVRRMFADVEADVYVLVDGDDTYDARCAPRLIDLLLKNSLDMVNLMLAVEAEFDLKIPDADMTLRNFRSISAIDALVATLLGNKGGNQQPFSALGAQG